MAVLKAFFVQVVPLPFYLERSTVCMLNDITKPGFSILHVSVIKDT